MLEFLYDNQRLVNQAIISTVLIVISSVIAGLLTRKLQAAVFTFIFLMIFTPVCVAIALSYNGHRMDQKKKLEEDKNTEHEYEIRKEQRRKGPGKPPLEENSPAMIVGQFYFNVSIFTSKNG
jgi:uncharacterized protein YacL